jgi:SAM-dependent methyltransferase
MITEKSSFRDYHSILGHEKGAIKRLLHKDYLPHYLQLITSGLYNRLIEKKLLVAHQENTSNLNPDYPIELVPDRIPFISYPYEWTFNQLKDAAILTLEINRIALEHGMILKDANAFNVQFIGPNPVFIDTASFVKYEEGQAWSAYQQFCRHFLAPLALSHFGDIQLRKLLLSNIDGISLHLCKKMLPLKSCFNSGIFLHIWLNALGQKPSKRQRENKKLAYTQSKQKLLAVQEHLLSTLKSLNSQSVKSQWAYYYENTNYTKNDETQKEEILSAMTQQLNVSSILDLGANEGRYSRLLAEQVNFVLSTDYDEVAIAKNYNIAKSKAIENLQTLHLNLVNPTPAIGFANQERKSFLERVGVDLVLALALVHHLTITHDLSFEQLAKQLAQMGKYLIIEFPSREDEKVLIIAQGKPNQYQNYHRENFEAAFGKFYHLKSSQTIRGNNRLLYCYERKV